MDITVSWWQYGLISLTACACSWVNALAGGGILLLYPLLTSLGIPPLATNVCIKLGLFPGSIGAMSAELNLLKGQMKNIWLTIPPAFAGALLGAWIVTSMGEKSFVRIVPFCIIFASLLMAFSGKIKAWLAKNSGIYRDPSGPTLALTSGTFASGIYSGYFGAGNGLIYFGLLSIAYDEDIKRLNALRQVTITSSHAASAVFFAFSAFIDWKIVFFIFIGSMIGGYLGGKTSEAIDPGKLRTIIVAFGLCFGTYLLLKNMGLVPRL